MRSTLSVRRRRRRPPDPTADLLAGIDAVVEALEAGRVGAARRALLDLQLVAGAARHGELADLAGGVRRLIDRGMLARAYRVAVQLPDVVLAR